MIHAEVLPGSQIACLRALAPVATNLGFHLAGGTAVALTVGHRQSVDFDWFTPRFPGQQVDLATLLASEGVTLETTSLADQTVHGLVRGIRVSFLEFRPPLLEPLEWEDAKRELRDMVRLAAHP